MRQSRHNTETEEDAASTSQLVGHEKTYPVVECVCKNFDLKLPASTNRRLLTLSRGMRTCRSNKDMCKSSCALARIRAGRRERRPVRSPVLQRLQSPRSWECMHLREQGRSLDSI